MAINKFLDTSFMYMNFPEWPKQSHTWSHYQGLEFSSLAAGPLIWSSNHYSGAPAREARQRSTMGKNFC